MNKKITCPITFPQKERLDLEKKYGNTNINNIGGVYYLEENADRDILKQAINRVIAENDGLRLNFEVYDNEYVQTVADYLPIDIDYIDFSSDGNNNRLQEFLSKKNKTPYTLTGTNLFYFAVIRDYKGQYGVFVNIHHLIADGFTFGLIIKQVIEQYIQLKDAAEENIPIIKKPSYIDYISLEQEYINSEKFIRNKDYWLNELSTIPKPLKQVDRNQVSITSNFVFYNLDSATASKIRDFSNTTYIYQFFLSVLFISLCKASANNDIIIGTVDKGRYGLPGNVMSMTGMFVLTLPFRMGIDPSMSFEVFYKKIINKKRKINVNKRYPIGLIKEDLAAIHKKDMDLFDVILCYEEVDFSINDSGSKLTIDWL
ncbi:MAG: hypothetical protein GY754_19100, partial [bacterium]|nr:hypothetical protein [bacterium]